MEKTRQPFLFAQTLPETRRNGENFCLKTAHEETHAKMQPVQMRKQAEVYATDVENTGTEEGREGRAAVDGSGCRGTQKGIYDPVAGASAPSFFSVVAGWTLLGSGDAASFAPSSPPSRAASALRLLLVTPVKQSE